MSAQMPPPPPSTPPPPQGYPVAFSFTPPDRVANWRPLVHWLLAIPHMFVLWVLGFASGFVLIAMWFVGVFTGRVPEGLQSFIVMTHRYSTRVSTYVLFLRPEYPAFSLSTTFPDPGDDRARLDAIPQVEGRSRLTIFFRYFMLIPQMLFGILIGIGAYVVTLIAFFAVLFTGRWPSGMRDFILGALRWQTRIGAYGSLLTDQYPPFNLN